MKFRRAKRYIEYVPIRIGKRNTIIDRVCSHIHSIKINWFPLGKVTDRGCFTYCFILWSLCLILLCAYVNIFKGIVSFLEQRMM